MHPSEPVDSAVPLSPYLATAVSVVCVQSAETPVEVRGTPQNEAGIGDDAFPGCVAQGQTEKRAEIQ